jgi:hypothetical protein
MLRRSVYGGGTLCSYIVSNMLYHEEVNRAIQAVVGGGVVKGEE